MSDPGFSGRSGQGVLGSLVDDLGLPVIPEGDFPQESRPGGSQGHGPQRVRLTVDLPSSLCETLEQRTLGCPSPGGLNGLNL